MFFANRMLTDPERNDTAEFLAIGDSMFHHITFESRADLGEAAKVSYSGQRIAEIYRYCSFAFSHQPEVVILNIGTNDLLKRFKYPRGPLTVEDCFQSLVAFIEWAFGFYRPKLIIVCTLIPIPKDDGFNKDADVFNQYIYAYAKSHVRVVVLETALKIYDVIKRRGWGEIYHADKTHLDKHRGAYLLSDLINQALDYFAMDKPGIVSSKILTDQTDWNDRLVTLYIRDFHNFFRRRYLKLRAEAMEKGNEIPEIRLQSRKVEVVIPEPWLHEVDGKPPYDANHVADLPDETQPIKEDSSRVKFMAMLIRKAAWVKGRGAVSASIAKQEAIDKLKAGKSKLPKQ